jgi:hypothetical protein
MFKVFTRISRMVRNLRAAWRRRTALAPLRWTRWSANRRWPRLIRVLFPIMLWDQGTHAVGAADWDATVKLFAEIGADGINGDTLRGVPRVYRTASDRVGHPLALEPESGLDSDEMLMWNNMTSGYWHYSSAPAGPGEH